MFARIAERVGLGQVVRGCCGAAVVALLAANSSQVAAQGLTLEELTRQARETQAFGTLLSCGSAIHPLQPYEPPVEIQVDKFLARTRGAGKSNEPLKLSFLLAPPFACTPRADRLFTQSLDEIASTSFDEVRRTVWPPLDRAGRVGTFAERKEWDRRAAKHEERLASIRAMLLERRWEDAHDLLDELYPDRRSDTLVRLAELLLLSTDDGAQRYALRCLDRAEAAQISTRLSQIFEVPRLFGNVALKERRWSEARLHFMQALIFLTDDRDMLPLEEHERHAKELHMALAYLAERGEQYEQAMTHIDFARGIDPEDVTALLHLGVNVFFRDRFDRKRFEAEALSLFEDAYRVATKDEGVRFSRKLPLPALLMAELRAYDAGKSKTTREVLDSWEVSLSMLEKSGLPASERARLMLRSVEMYAELSEFGTAAQALAAAEKLDPTIVESSPKFATMLFATSDARTAKLFGERFMADPADLTNARMLVLTLLESSEPKERLRGAKLAELLHRAHPENVPLKVAAASAHFIHDRNAEALRLVGPLVGIEPERPHDRLSVERKPAGSTKYEFARGMLSPFSLDDMNRVSIATMQSRPVYDLGERSYPLVLKSPIDDAQEDSPPAPILAPDDAYLVARILVRTDDGGPANQTARAVELLKSVMKSHEMLRYRQNAGHLLLGLGGPGALSGLLPPVERRIQILPSPLINPPAYAPARPSNETKPTTKNASF